MCVDVEVICILHVQALCMCFAVIVYCRMHVWYRTYHVVPQRTHTLASLELVIFGQTCSSMSLECKTVLRGYAIHSDLIGICFLTPAHARRELWAMELVMVATYYCWYFCNGHGMYKII